MHGAHDFRHTFSTWLEDAGIPPGHRRADGPTGQRTHWAVSGQRIVAHDRHTTPEMAARTVAAVEERLVVGLATAEVAFDQQPW